MSAYDDLDPTVCGDCTFMHFTTYSDGIFEGFCTKERCFVTHTECACNSWRLRDGPLVPEKTERPKYRKSTTFEEWVAWREAKGVES